MRPALKFLKHLVRGLKHVKGGDSKAIEQAVQQSVRKPLKFK
jgi:hypothetical protein